MLSLSALYRYPLKSAAAEVLSHSLVGAQGLIGDRRWMLVDVVSGRFLTQRALPAIGRISGSVAGRRLACAFRRPGWPNWWWHGARQ